MQRIDNTLNWPFDAYRSVLFRLSLARLFFHHFGFSLHQVFCHAQNVSITHIEIYSMFMDVFCSPFFSTVISFVCTNTPLAHRLTYKYMMILFVIIRNKTIITSVFAFAPTPCTLCCEKKNLLFFIIHKVIDTSSLYGINSFHRP